MSFAPESRRARPAGKGRFLKVLPNADAPNALKWIEEECTRVRAGIVLVEQPKTRFCDYAASLFERKVATMEIKRRKRS